MMSDPVKHKSSAVLGSLEKVTSAHAAVKQGIATHAQKHEVAIDDKRESARQVQAINAGIAQHNQPV